MSDGRTTTTGGPAEASAGDADALRLQVEALSVEAEFLRRALEGRDADRSRQESALSALFAERDALAARLDAILNSTTWRATAPLRQGLARWRGAHRATVPRPEGGVETRPAHDPQATQPPPDRAEAPPAWYGAIRLEAGQLSGLGRVAGPYGPGVYERLTQAVARRYGHVTVNEGAVAERARTEAAPLARRRLASVPIPDGVRPSETPARYAIVTPFYRHLAFFGPCAASVAALTDEGGADAARVEWIVVNDDPGVTAQELEALIPDTLRARTRILSDGRNRGIVARLNEGIAATRLPWILFLDCDDALEPETIRVLDHYIALFPRCRCIASAMTDIDEEGRDLRPRFHTHPTIDLFEQGMVASHLKAVRRDLLEGLGGLDPSLSGVQDYDFALRAALREPLLQVPELLYRYRWHAGSQTVFAQARQAALARAARARFLRAVMDEDAGA